MNTRPITWIETEPGRVWRSVDGRYAIVANTLPENPPRTVYQARMIDEAMARAYPEEGNLGHLLKESLSCWNSQDDLYSAEAECRRHAYALAHKRPFPINYPAVELDRVGNLTNGALAIVWNDGQLFAQVLGMHIVNRDEGFVPGVWTEINLTELGLVPREGVELTTTSDRPEPCGNCGVKVGQPHEQSCSFARCLATGGQRLMCTYFGGFPIAGMEAVVTGSQDEFERYFKTPTGHDCGQDVWSGER